MSHSNKGNGLAGAFKSLVVACLRLAAISVGFVCRVTSLLLSKLAELTDKLSGHDSHH